jgi:hypothetical protein
MGALVLLLAFLPALAVAQDDLASVRMRTAVTWLGLLGIEQPGLLATAKAGGDDGRAFCLSVQAWADAMPNACAGEGGGTATDEVSEQVRDTERRFLKPNLMERVARVPQFDSEFLRTANYVYGVPEGAPKSTSPSILPNPDHGLLSLGGTLDFSELFPNVQSRLDYCTALKSLEKTKYKKDVLGQDPSIVSQPGDKALSACNDWKYLAIEGFAGALQRYAIATAIKVTVSQIPEFQSGVVIPSPRWTYTVTGSINPAALFTSISDRKALAEYYSKEGGKSFLNDRLKSTCGSNQVNGCLSYLAIGHKTKHVALALALLPHVDVKAYSPFDLAKTASNTFLSLPGGDKALYDFTLTWDVRNAIASMQMRSDAVNACRELVSCKSGHVGEPSANGNATQEIKKVKLELAEKFADLAFDPGLAGRPEWWEQLRDEMATYALARQGSAKR